MVEKSKFLPWLLTIGILVVLAIIVSVITKDTKSSFIAIFGLVYLLFLPGYIITWAFLRAQEMDLIERMTLSFALSIAIVPLVIIIANRYLHIPFSFTSIFIEVLVVMILAIVARQFLKGKLKKKDKKSKK